MDYTYAIPIAVARKENILTSKLSGFSCKTIPIGLGVEMYPGGFCQSFPFYENGGKKKMCLRLWHDDDSREENLQHIKNISSLFDSKSVKYVVPFSYEEKVLRIEGGMNSSIIIPGVVMDWVEGDKLIDYVRKNYKNHSLMKQLADRFLKMVRYLNSNGMAHGDLSGDNIIVESSGELVLVDYDSFYIKGYTEGVKQITAGIRCYQHPERNTSQFLSEKMDYFSQQVIYLSLNAISEDPSIFDENIDKGILFSDDDIDKKNFTHRPIYGKIKAIRSDEVQYCLKELERALSGPLSEVRSIVDFKIPEPARDIMANYCGICGHHFNNQTDLFCPDCGTKREKL